jgi:polyphosphate kinase
VDERVIQALYRASQAGVRIDLVVRGVCCLRPGVAGMSENIAVRSVVDRFLEHSRVWYFENGCQPQVYVASADWMPRNFFRRIEVAFPVEDGVIVDRIAREILGVTLADTVKARLLQPDGSYRRVGEIPARVRGSGKRGVNGERAASGAGTHGTGASAGRPRRSQEEFMKLAAASESGRWTGTKRRRGRHPEVKLAPRPFELGPKAMPSAGGT